jgi:hypothetical protein
VEQADRFAKRMQDAGNRIEYHRMPNWDHAFAIPTCGTDQQIAEALRLTDRFLAGLGYIRGEATIAAGRGSAPRSNPATSAVEQPTSQRGPVR